MRLKKILATASAFAIALSAFVAVPAQAEGKATATLSFVGYETKGAATFAKIKVSATIPDTLKPYALVAADWETTFEDTYTGTVVSNFGIDIPYITGLTYVASLSKVHTTDFVAINDNASASCVSVYYANTGDYSSKYSGEIGELATLYYRITGDVDATYDVKVSVADLGCKLFTWADGTTSPTPTEINYIGEAGWTVTNAVVKPAAPPATTYTVTATSDVEVTGANISAPVAEGTKLNVAPKAKEGYTAKLLANGTEVAAGEYTVTSNVDFAVAYAPKHEYTLDDKGTCLKDSIKGIYYSLSVKNVADKLAIKVSDKTFEAKGVPTVEGATLAQMTYAIFQVPDEIYNNVPAITAVTSGETVYSVAE